MPKMAGWRDQLVHRIDGRQTVARYLPLYVSFFPRPKKKLLRSGVNLPKSDSAIGRIANGR